MKNINSFWGYLLIDELVRNDITYFCISPGSRSTPLTIAAAENTHAEKIICLDERAAAFHALGYARATGRPAVVICTSGTAAANYYPAIIEAKESQIPLIILTADRPPELRDTGSNQTIDQVKLYSQFLNWQFDMPCPDTQIPAEFVLSTIDQAVYRAIAAPAGPVHLNCMFREPLEPSEKLFSDTYQNSIQVWDKLESPFTSYSDSMGNIDDTELEKIGDLINTARSGLLVVGQLNRESERQAVTEFAAKLGWPVLPDIASGIRQNKESLPLISYFDQILLSERSKKIFNRDLIIHIGRPLTSKRFLSSVKEFSARTYIQIESGTDRLDPAHLVTHRICGDIKLICSQLIGLVDSDPDNINESHLVELNNRVETVLDPYCLSEISISEISLARLVAQNISPDQGLFLSSSMPIRDFDMYTGAKINTSFISSNRGVSGIDGTLATAVGFAGGLKKKVTVVLGDVAMLHDMNSLSQVSESKYPITIVVVNNRGGGIFSFLPISNFKTVFEKYFATPHNYQFKSLSEMFGIGYESPATNGEFVDVFKRCIKSNTSTIIEISTTREDNYILHQEIQNKITSILEK